MKGWASTYIYNQKGIQLLNGLHLNKGAAILNAAHETQLVNEATSPAIKQEVENRRE